MVENSSTIAVVERYLTRNWNQVTNPKAKYHNDVYFFVKFLTIENTDKVLYACPHMIQNWPIIMKVLEVDFDLNKEVLRMIPV